MKSLKDFKEALKIGSTWSCYNSFTKVTRISKVIDIQGDAVIFSPGSSDRKPLWLFLSEADKLTFINNNDGKISVKVKCYNSYLLYTPVTEKE